MSKILIRLVVALAVAAMTGWLVPSVADESRTFRGTYDWANGGSDTLRAEFEPDGDGAWKVEFSFDFSGDGYTWKGTATGSLEDGSDLTGTASWSRNHRTWVFTAKLVDGVLSGKHAEVRGDKETPSGTFRLTR